MSKQPWPSWAHLATDVRSVLSGVCSKRPHRCVRKPERPYKSSARAGTRSVLTRNVSACGWAPLSPVERYGGLSECCGIRGGAHRTRRELIRLKRGQRVHGAHDGRAGGVPASAVSRLVPDAPVAG